MLNFPYSELIAPLFLLGLIVLSAIFFSRQAS